MVGLYCVGVLASYLLVLKREGRALPWRKIGIGTGILLLIIAVIVIVLIKNFGYHLTWHPPFLVK
jgi:hypothetical protein